MTDNVDNAASGNAMPAGAAQAAGCTHVSVVLDRSGSMASIADDVIGGFNGFLSEQRAASGKATLSLVQFDSQDPYEKIYNFQLLPTVPELTRKTFVPRGMTPLLDAVGMNIEELDATLARLGDGERPAKILVVVVTDGQENHSQRFRHQDIKRLIDARTELGWEFVFLAADLGAFEDAERMGFRESHRMAFDKSGRGARDAFGDFSKNVRMMRAGEKSAAYFDEVDRLKHDMERTRRGGGRPQRDPRDPADRT